MFFVDVFSPIPDNMLLDFVPYAYFLFSIKKLCTKKESTFLLCSLGTFKTYQNLSIKPDWTNHPASAG